MLIQSHPSSCSTLETFRQHSLKSDHLLVDAELAMTVSFVTIGGGLKYKRNEESMSDSKGFSLRLKETTETRMLTMKHYEDIRRKLRSTDNSVSLPVKQLLESNEATHIISGKDFEN